MAKRQKTLAKEKTTIAGRETFSSEKFERS